MKSFIFTFIIVIGCLAIPQVAVGATLGNGDAEWNASFGNWYGVNNTTATTRTTTRVTNGDAEWNASFGNWAGSSSSSTGGNALAGWSGVNNGTTNTTSTTNLRNGDDEWNAAFGNWTSVAPTNQQLAYNANGYPTSKTLSAGTASTEAQRTSTFFVAPTSGVNKWAPLTFTGMLMAGFAVFRHRKALFS